jgi:hypothetical protein
VKRALKRARGWLKPTALTLIILVAAAFIFKFAMDFLVAWHLYQHFMLGG